MHVLRVFPKYCNVKRQNYHFVNVINLSNATWNKYREVDVIAILLSRYVVS